MSPAFQFYPADWLAAACVSMATLEEEGAYIRLLCYAWREGSIPADSKKCALLVGKGITEETVRVVQGWFNQHPTDSTKLVHKRLEREREKQRIWSEKSADGGRKSAQMRKKSRLIKGGSTTLGAKPQPNGNSSSSFSSSNITPTPLEIVEAWNRTSLPKVSNLSDDRKRHLSARLSEPFWHSRFQEGMNLADKSDFLKGNNDRGWKITFDWFVKPGNLEKILEGKYDKPNGEKPMPRPRV